MPRPLAALAEAWLAARLLAPLNWLFQRLVAAKVRCWLLLLLLLLPPPLWRPCCSNVACPEVAPVSQRLFLLPASCFMLLLLAHREL